MKIAIIDSGIDFDHKRLKGCDIVGISIKKENGRIVFFSDFFDTMGHGTACAAIIHKSIPEATLCAVKIYHADLTTREDMLIEALKWVRRQDDIKVISISLSTCEPNIELTRVCEELYEMGKILVASCDNNFNLRAFPAFYPWVFGVMSGQIKKATDIGCFSEDETLFVAKGSIQRVAWSNGEDLIVTGTSYATPHLAGLIANIIEENPAFSFDDIKQRLISLSKPDIVPLQFIGKSSYYKVPMIRSIQSDHFASKLFNPCEKLNWIGKMGIFPISEKEMKQFIDFPHLTKFNIKFIFDYPRTFSSFGINDKKDYNRNLPTNAEIKDIDTFVIGYYYDNLWEGNVVFGNRLIDIALKNKKNFFLYDHRLYDYVRGRIDNKQHVYIPQVTEEDYKEIDILRSLPNVKCPVVMVIGTGNKQGKFTTQLRLKEILEKEGYSVGFVSTEPQGELFGANYVFPYGYMSTIQLKPIERLLLLRNIFKGISEYVKPHIMITGSQGALLPENPLTPVPYLATMDSIGMIYGALPDIVVCAIDPNDSIAYIKKTIQIAQLYSRCNVAFYVMTPWVKPQNYLPQQETYISDSLFAEKKYFFQEQLKKPVINIMDRSNDQLILETIESLCQ